MLSELSQTEISEVFRNNYIGRLGCRDGDKIYIIPVNYLYENGMVMCRSYDGFKVSLMRKYPDICFEVEELHSFNHWKTVIGWGTFEELTNPADIEHAQISLSDMTLMQKASLSSGSPAEESAVHRDFTAAIVYYRIRFRELSGRYEQRL